MHSPQTHVRLRSYPFFYTILLTAAVLWKERKKSNMRLSCNGCRVLRKGCSDTCIIRPCLDWLPSPESQSNATLFLAKFYGRAALLNLINAGPSHHRPAIFKSLLYEACGRIVNPVHGSAGLLWTGRWNLCQAAVDDALKGSPIKPISAVDDQSTASAFKACDILHVSKSGDVVDHTSNSLSDLHMAPLNPVRQTRFKRIGLKGKTTKPNPSELLNAKSGSSGDGSALRHHAPSQSVGADGDVVDDRARVELDLTLGRGPVQKEESSGPDEAASEADLGLGLGLGCWH